jgi:cysteine desulfurase
MLLKMEIYLDYAATTPVDPRVKKEMDRYFSKEFANPGSMHSPGLRVKKAIEKARGTVAKILNCLPEEIIFTGSGTESINLAIKGVAGTHKKGHIITSKIEHKAVLETCKHLEKEGYEVTYLDVDREGFVNLEKLEKAIKENTLLITIMYANNEIGTIQYVEKIGAIARKHDTLFHTDACQAAGAEELDVKKLNIDLLTLNGSKIYGPKGVGILYRIKGVKLQPLIHGGGQEFGLRSGTENTPGIIGFSKALELAQKERITNNKKMIYLRDKLIKGLLKIPKTILNGSKTKRLPNNVNISILDVEGESLMLHLNEEGIECSTGSACTSESLEPSHVILAIGQPHEIAHGSLRFSLGKYTTGKDVDKVIKTLPKIAKILREISPVNLRVRNIK